MSNKKDHRTRGLRLYEKMGWGDNAGVRHLDKDLWEIITDVMFGQIWSRPGLSLRDRELVTLAALIAVEAEGMKLHMRNAHKLGISMKEIKEVIIQVMYYLGQPKGLFAMRRLKEVIAEKRASKAG